MIKMKFMRTSMNYWNGSKFNFQIIDAHTNFQDIKIMKF